MMGYAALHPSYGKPEGQPPLSYDDNVPLQREDGNLLSDTTAISNGFMRVMPNWGAEAGVDGSTA